MKCPHQSTPWKQKRTSHTILYYKTRTVHQSSNYIQTEIIIDNLTLCFRERPRIACFGPQEDRAVNDEAGNTFPADRQPDSEILTFEREVKKRKKGGKRPHQTLSQRKRREKTDKKSRFSTEKQPFSDTKHTT